jgi:hypothetical protein
MRSPRRASVHSGVDTRLRRPPVGWHRPPHGEVQRHAIERILQVHFCLWDRETLASTDSATLVITTDNRLLHAQHGAVATRRRIFAWAVHVINVLSSPSVKLVYQAPPEA